MGVRLKDRRYNAKAEALFAKLGFRPGDKVPCSCEACRAKNPETAKFWAERGVT